MNGEAKHTPGPWKADHFLVTAANKREVTHTGLLGRRRASYPDCDGGAEDEANARLIAESPDLIQSLTELTQSASELLAQMPLIAPKAAEILRADVAKGLEVIARAKGE